MSLTGERVVLPSLHCNMFLLWVDNWGTELHVSNIPTSFRHSEQEIEQLERGKFGHD